MEDRDLKPGDIIGGFRIERILGRGGMGVVYKAHELSLNRKVALKVLSSRLSADKEFIKRFKREAQVVAALNHPNIVSILSYGEENGIHYFAMDYVSGRDLGEILKEQKIIPLEEALDITAQVADALAEAGAKGVVHRDMKPSNIMIDKMKRAYVTDFGVAHFTQASEKLTQTGLFLGTPEYASPEQAMGKPLDVRSDIYSLGAVLYRMLSGDPPITGESPLAVVAKIATEPVPPISQVNPLIPKPVCDIIDKMLAKNVEDRFQDPKEVVDAINKCRETLKGGAYGTGQGQVTAPPHEAGSQQDTGFIKAKKVGIVAGIALAVLLMVWMVDALFFQKHAPKTIPTGQLVIEGRVEPGKNIFPPVTGPIEGTVHSNIGEDTGLETDNSFRITSSRPVPLHEPIVITGLFYANDGRFLRPSGGRFTSVVTSPKLDIGNIPLETTRIELKPLKITAQPEDNTRIDPSSLTVTIDGRPAKWDGRNFIGDCVFKKKDDTVKVVALYRNVREGYMYRGEKTLHATSFTYLLENPGEVKPVTVKLVRQQIRTQKDKAGETANMAAAGKGVSSRSVHHRKAILPKNPSVVIMVSGNENMIPVVEAALQKTLSDRSLNAVPMVQIPILREKTEWGRRTISWYEIKQLRPKVKANILVVAKAREMERSVLQYYGRREILTSASVSIQAVDVDNGSSIFADSSPTINYTFRNKNEEIKSAVASMGNDLAEQIKRYWKKKLGRR